MNFRSRLHLISTLAQEMKQYVKHLREDEISDFSSREKLHDFVRDSFVRYLFCFWIFSKWNQIFFQNFHWHDSICVEFFFLSKVERYVNFTACFLSRRFYTLSARVWGLHNQISMYLKCWWCDCSPPKETICHVDLDCFFVSVAQRTHKEIIGKPVAITHSKVIIWRHVDVKLSFFLNNELQWLIKIQHICHRLAVVLWSDCR